MKLRIEPRKLKKVLKKYADYSQIIKMLMEIKIK
jgi:hypothetical protein